MTRIFNILLNEDRAVAKILLGLTRGTFQLGFQILLFPNNVHAFAATTGSRLDENRVRQCIGHLKNLFMAAHHAKGDRNTMLDGNFPRFYLVAHQSH